MNGVYVEFYELISSIYGMPEGAPEAVQNAMYWLSWSMLSFILLLIFFLFLFGIWLIVRTLINKKRNNAQEVHYYYHK